MNDKYQDLEIRCLVDAIDRYRITEDDKTEEKSHRLRDIFGELKHVLELLLESSAALQLDNVLSDLEGNIFGVQAAFNEYKEGVELFLQDELDCSSLKAAQEEAEETSWLRVPDDLDSDDAEQLLKAFADEPAVELHEVLDAIKDLAGKDAG